MGIRVIAGTAKGRQLKLVPGDTTRPIMDRVKESLFNIIGRDIYDAAFLDLFAGTGSVGIEALSRGAAYALLIDLEPRALRTIEDNLKLTKLASQATVRRADALALLKQTPDRAYDFIYVAPPQYKSLWQKTLQAIDDHPAWLQPDGEVIVQIDPTENEPFDLKHFQLSDERRYGNTLLLFFQQSSGMEDSTSG